MSIVQLLEWVESTDLSTAIREGALPYPIIGGFHLLGIALFGGMVLVPDLRLLGWAMPSRPVSEMIEQFRPWKIVGFVIVVASGLLLTWAEPLKLYRSPSFWIKMVLMLLVGVHALIFRQGVYAHPAGLDENVTRRAKIAAILSLLIWAGLIVAGRLIAYDE